MEESKRWIVTYTKHLRQKRKVYQDGVLELHCPSNKVMLYDDSGKLLDSRFLKKDDLVECGVTLAFETCLVDIGDLDETRKPLKDYKVNGSDGKSNGTIGIYGQNSRSSFLGNKKIKLKTTREVQNQPNARQARPAIAREWDVLYTTQLTQKAKRYHDGILKLESSGSHANQLILLKEDGTVLSSKFQTSAECLSVGNTYEMPNYLVEICNQRNSQGDAVDKNRETHSCIQKDFLPNATGSNMKGLEKPKKCPPSEELVIRSSGVRVSTEGEEVLRNKQLHRDALQILFALRRPAQESLLTRNPPAEQACPPQSLDSFHSDLQACGGALRSVTSPEIPSNIPKLMHPDCKVELLAANCSAASSLLYGEDACETSVTNPGVGSTANSFLDVGTSSIVWEDSDSGNGSSGRVCIEESLEFYAEEKPDWTGLYNNRMQIEEQGKNNICGQLHSDDMNSEKEGTEGILSSSASSLGYVTAFPSADYKDTASELKTSPGKTTTAGEFPSFDLGIEL